LSGKLQGSEFTATEANITTF